MSDPIKHHYVPQCYLKKFSLDKINVNYYDKELCKCDKSKINEICQLENFYKLSQSAPYYIETDFFANNYEDKLGRILTHFETIDIDLDKISYDKKHRINLSRQIVLQYMLTPFYRNTKCVGTQPLNNYTFHRRIFQMAYCILNKTDINIPSASDLGDLLEKPDGISFAFKNISSALNQKTVYLDSELVGTSVEKGKQFFGRTAAPVCFSFLAYLKSLFIFTI